MENFLNSLGKNYIIAGGVGAALILAGTIGLIASNSSSPENNEAKEVTSVTSTQSSETQKEDTQQYTTTTEEETKITTNENEAPIVNNAPSQTERDVLTEVSENDMSEIDKLVQKEREKNKNKTEWDRIKAEGSFGESLSIDGLFVTVVKVKDGENGGTISVVAENKTTEPVDLMPLMFAVLDDKGARPVTATLSSIESTTLVGSIPPGAKVQGELQFDVPIKNMSYIDLRTADVMLWK